jgi:DNA-binding transcriptional ArsR family regulator
MDLFAVLDDPVRRQLMEALAAEPQPVRDLVARFPISQPAISRHLRVLREAGLVETVTLTDDARLRLYRLRPEPLRPLLGWLQQFWQGQLDSFATYVEEQS